MVDWDKRYREGFYNGVIKPHQLLRRFWSLIPGPDVVDIASGSGRDSLFLAERGHRVWSLEKSEEAIRIAQGSSRAAGKDIFMVRGDAHDLPFKKNSADGIIVFYFLLRNIMGEIVNLLRKDGILIYETFLNRQNAVDRPRNPDFLLDDGELLSYFKDLDLLFYEETVSVSGEKKRATARYVGRKR
jgi:SAM-dependent methyltransferase